MAERLGHPITDDELLDILIAAVDTRARWLPRAVPIEGVLAEPCSHYKFNAETLRNLGMSWSIPPGGGGFIVTIMDDDECSFRRFQTDVELEQGWAGALAHHPL